MKINWTNTLFLILTPIAGIAGTIALALNHMIHTNTLFLLLFFVYATGMSITGGYHRLFSHKAYNASWLVRLLYLFFGAAAFEGSALEWCTDHRNHHLHTDTDQDPYNAKRGFWFSHIGWLLTLDASKRNLDNVKDLQSDPLVKLQSKYYVRLAIFSGFFTPALIASLWGDWLGGLIIAGALRITLNHHFTFCINSLCHIFGKCNYSDRNTSRDNWVTALLTYGEGYHNFHHQFPLDYRNGIRAYHFDPTKWLIKALSLLGMAKNLRTINQHKIVEKKMEMYEKYLHQKTKHCEKLFRTVAALAAPIQERITQILSRLENLEKEYKELKLSAVKEKVAECRKHLRNTQRELKSQLRLWKHLLRKHHLVRVSA